MPKVNKASKPSPKDILSYKEYIQISIDYWETYHHHKEQMAYAASALFLTGAAAITFLNISPVIQGSLLTWLVLLGLVTTTAVVGGVFIFWQLRHRQTAAAMLRACGLLLAEWLTMPPGSDDLAVEISPTGRPPTKALTRAYDEVKHTYNWFESPALITVATGIVVAMWGVVAIGRILLGGLACVLTC